MNISHKPDDSHVNIKELITHIIRKPDVEHPSKTFLIGSHTAEYKTTGISKSILKGKEHKLWTPYKKTAHTRCFMMLNINVGDLFVINHVLDNGDLWIKSKGYKALIISPQSLAATLNTGDQFESPLAIDITETKDNTTIESKVAEISNLVIELTNKIVKQGLHFDKRVKRKSPPTQKASAIPPTVNKPSVSGQDSVTLDRITLVQQLRSFNPDPVIEKYRKNDLAGKSSHEILTNFAFGSSIYRAFRHESPMSRYKKWRWYDKADELLENMDATKNQEEFDDLVYDVAESLVEDWGDKKDNGKPTYMNMGIAMKITNLIFKHFAFSDHSRNPDVKNWLHVPWDQYTLLPLKNVWQEKPSIPKNPRQGFVNNLQLYKKLHSLITDIANEAGVARIIYEFWAWDRPR